MVGALSETCPNMNSETNGQPPKAFPDYPKLLTPPGPISYHNLAEYIDANVTPAKVPDALVLKHHLETLLKAMV